jgi:hypothetical protein
MLAVAALTFAACTLETPSATPTDSPTAAPTTIPLPGGGTVIPGDTLVVYTANADVGAGASPTAAATATGDQAAPARTVHVYDVTQGKQVASFGFGTKDDPPIRAALANGQVITATQRRVTSQRLDGSAPRSIYVAPASGEVLDMDVSADGALLAIVARSEAKNAATAIVRVNYLVSGGRALTLGIGDPRFANFQGTFADIHWQPPGRGTPSFVLVGATDEEGHTASSAIVSVDGAVQVAQPSGPTWLAPAADTWAVIDNLVCTKGRLAGHHLSVHEIDSDKVIWQTDDATPLYTPVEWSPDGDVLIYATRPDAQSSCDASVQVPAQLYQVDLKSGQVSAVADLNALHQKWYGQALVTASCPVRGPVTDRWQHQAPLCPADSSSIVTISVGGSEVGKAAGPTLTGIVTESGSATPTPTNVPETTTSANTAMDRRTRGTVQS